MDMAFLDRMAICFFLVLGAGLAATWLKPMREPVILPVNHAVSLESSRGAKWLGGLVCLLTMGLYVVFW